MSESIGGEGGESLSLDTTPPLPPPSSLISPSHLISYIKRIFTSLDDEGTTEQLYHVLSDSVEFLQKFIADGGVKTLFVQKIIGNTDDDNANPTSIPHPSAVDYIVSSEVRYKSLHSTGILFTKRGSSIEIDKSIASQVRTVILNEGSPYETLHSYISTAVSPYFKSYLHSVEHPGSSDSTGTKGSSGDNKLGPSIEKKLTELELGLLHLQQNIDIPEISLVINPTVAQVISVCSKEVRKPKIEDFGDKVHDSTFLNSLQQGVNRWIKEIQKVTKLERDPSNGTTLQEINFWLNLERSLIKLQEKRESLEIELTLDILRHGKRFHATVSFDADTGLKEALAKVTDFNQLMKDFPINELLSAADLDKIKVGVVGIFVHLKKIRNTKYPINRSLKLIEAISKDLLNQLLKVLGTRRLMALPFPEFESLMLSCSEIFNAWEEEYEKLQGLLRDIVKKKRSSEEIKQIWRISPSHKKLQSRMEGIKKFRVQHEQLRTVIERVLRSEEGGGGGVGGGGGHAFGGGGGDSYISTPNEEVQAAYSLVEHIDLLDISKEGSELWEEILKNYNEKINSVESKITAELREQLATAKSANEMFRIFARFNALFVRPQIRGAIREYQTQLISRVKEDIEKLHEKFKVQYGSSKAARMSELRDIPPVSGSIIWAKQIDRQLNTYLKRVESILGTEWEKHVDGQRLKADGDSFRGKLNTQYIFETWVLKVQQKDTTVTGRIFDIETSRVKNPTTGKYILKLKVNFLPEVITLSKEVRHLKNLGFRVPLAIMNKAHQANQMYPFAISLIESIRAYERALERIEDNSNVNLLLAGTRNEVHTLISEGIGLVWESYKLDPYVKKLSDSVYQFSEKVDEVLNILQEITAEIKSLETCLYSNKTFSDILGKIQKSVDALSLKNYTNLGRWALWVDSEVEKRLSSRLEAGISSWTNCLAGVKNEEEEEEDDEEGRNGGRNKKNLGGDPEMGELKIELRMTQQTLWVFPPVEDVRQQLLTKLFSWEAIITLQPRIQSSRYQVALDKSSTSTSYKDLLSRLPGGPSTLEGAYRAIESKYSVVRGYVDEWLCYQSLWDLQPEVLYNRLESDLGLWIRCLNDIKQARSTFDTTEVRKTFGPVAVEYGKVQSKVSLKYDAWHKDVLTKFSHLLGNQMNIFYGEIGKARYDLEQQSIETSSTADAVNLITYVQNLKRKILSWEEEVVGYKDGQRLLERQRFQLPYNWLHIDTIEGEWSSFLEILKRKDGSIQTQVATLQTKILSEDKLIESRIQNYLSEWEREKPIKFDTKPSEALQQLSLFESRYTKLNDERVNILKAKEALEIQGSNPLTSPYQISYEELLDLKTVWSELNKITEQLEVLREKLWLSVVPRKIRTELDSLISQLKNLPGKLKQYASYEFIKSTLLDYTKVNSILIELKNESVKERHWRSLIKNLGLQQEVYSNMTELTLGHIWDVNLLKNRNVINEVLAVAQGELALEIFLKQVREHWNSNELELINYQNKTKLIKSWEELFTKLKEHLNSLVAMKLSPYYKIFDEETLIWEDKLNKINNLFDIWIDVQRRWVYLEGIFLSSEDIKILLPNESNRFSSISIDFLSLMKKVSKSPKPLEIISFPGILRSLERLSDMLNKIQKALGEYLERERNSFPRFYFIGDEDLLEIIGNSKNLLKLQKHYKKMFSGINSLVINESEILGMASREGEEILFPSPININNYKINEWLNLVESEMKNVLANLLKESLVNIVFGSDEVSYGGLLEWIDKFPIQLITISSSVWWTRATEAALGTSNLLPPLLSKIDKILEVLANSILIEQPLLRRKKYEHLITEFVHKRGVIRDLIFNTISNPSDFYWLKQMRFYYNEKEKELTKKLSISIGNASFMYGYEYLGVIDKLVQTPLTDKCYLTMTQALEFKLGGSPFGPAGTGKTESVKALGHSLGRFVLVFNCDETFDFQAMGRIFIGLCQVGAWGCFDEFNRLEERMLSAVSQQIQTIQEALKSGNLQIDLIGKQLTISPQMATFITMNPGYSGRSNLPDNLKQLFRSLAMTSPDRQLIAEVMLFSQGFKSAETLAAKIVPFFQLCEQQLSSQSHYDFGLRALKSVLTSSGNLKREYITRLKSESLSRGESLDELSISSSISETDILIQSICETIVPKLIAPDIRLLFNLLSDVFPGAAYVASPLEELKGIIRGICEENYLLCGEREGEKNLWMEKVLQLYQIQSIHHGMMLVGNSGTGKTAAWKILLKSLEKFDKIESNYYIINPKSISKENLYGFMDPNTREWSDGLFTHILRKIIDNLRGERSKRHWIVFDGDVDPEWIENLNSVLDDNKLLTLPNGERLALPPNVRLLFEVQDLKYATLATVSRCGMVWFSTDVVTNSMLYYNYLTKLKEIPLDESESSGDSGYFSIPPPTSIKRSEENLNPEISSTLQLQRTVSAVLQPFFSPNALIEKALNYISSVFHIMDYTPIRYISTLFSMINESVRRLILYNASHPDFPLDPEGVGNYTKKSLIYNLIWSFTGDTKLKIRSEFSEFIRTLTTVELPPGNLVDFEIGLNGSWSPWLAKVPQLEIDTNKVGSTDCVIPTIDTVRHETLLRTWLNEHKPLVLCGPPGSGKTMTLLSALRALPDMEVISLNFSSATTPELLLKTFDHYCEYKKTPNGIFLSPIQMNKWLILFCDEINLPEFDKYGTQRVISFLRQLVEYGTFYSSEHQLIKLERIQFVGACNPPTDPGRKPLSHRFLRHVPIIYVDYPGETSLSQIYGTFTHAMLKLIPNLMNYASALTSSMVEFYMKSQEKFTQEMQPHYIYSPRELTRWIRGIYEAIKPLDELDLDGLVRLWAHEGLRLFQDRLVHEEERKWTNELLDTVAYKYFPTIGPNTLLRPILYSNWLSKNYISVEPRELENYIKARLQIFYQEELDIPLVLFDDLLEHILRIDRIFKQSQGHLLLIGMAGSGKTTLSRFVAWINGLKIFQIKVHNKYTSADFDNDLKNILKLTGIKNEKICFILDESNVLDSSFLERMNTLLANGEVPGLFEGDEYNSLMLQIKESSSKNGLMLDSNEELYKYFCAQIIRNLHIIFTMNPKNELDLKSRASTSPALFNRCVLDWYGNWTDSSLFQVGLELTNKVDLDKTDYSTNESVFGIENPTFRDMVVNSFVYIHNSLIRLNAKLAKKSYFKVTSITPRHFLDFILHFTKLYNEKRANLEEEQLHLTRGLNKIKETVEQIEELKTELESKSKELNSKNELANSKLKEMMEKQQEAERRKVENQSIQKDLEKQNGVISEKQVIVKKDLELVEPAVRDAEQSVQSIKKQQLVEVRSMANPPALVKLALESICLLLGEFTTDWKQIRQVLMRENFITTIVNFNTELITDDIRTVMKTKYISNPDYNFEKVNRASLACGPLVKWAIAQYYYSDILKKIEPLRVELSNLQTEAETNKANSLQVTTDINSLESVIISYKEEYANLISAASVIKNDLVVVEQRVRRSLELIKKLSKESERWEESSTLFHKQMGTIVGDVLLSAAFLTYAGYYDQHYRQYLWTNWTTFLNGHQIVFKSDLALCEYLSHPDDRLRWKDNSLPDDDLCTENAIMIKRFNRYPLIIDPSGQAIEYLIKEYSDKKLTITSFLDDSFRKNLESALRFGNPLLVQDVENYDPLLNPVLNHEVKRSGGRVLITIGEQDIDLSPSFNIFLSTRDPSIEFSSDLASRVTFINFTITRSSLQYQCLNSVMKSERPDIDGKRRDLLKLQGEFQVRLRQLEKSLLLALNETKGKLLDDDSILTTLENLKTESIDISSKFEQTEVVIKEIETVSKEYLPLANHCSSIYFTLEYLNNVHFLYQYSLQFFLEIFTTVLSSKQLKNVVEYPKRIEIITRDLFQVTYDRVSRGMLHSDRLILCLLLGKIYSKGKYETLYQLLLHFKDGLVPNIDSSHNQLLEHISGDQLQNLLRLAHKLPSIFSSLLASIRGNLPDFTTWLKSPTPESSIPPYILQGESGDETAALFHKILLINALRPDRLLAILYMLSAEIFGSDFSESGELDLNTIVRNEIEAGTPVLLCSVPGYDPSGRVEALALNNGVQLSSIAIGSSEGFTLADSTIKMCIKNGRWVLLKNVHLAPSWLLQLEKKLHSLQPHPNFRLFLTMDIHPKIPVNLLRSGRIFVYESPPGIKYNLLRIFNTMSPERMGRAPIERSKLYFLLAWFHSIIKERLRYVPLGWSKSYEFNESDLLVSFDTIDSWIDGVAANRTNLPPDKIPWTALKTLLSQIIYGGKIDNEFDSRLISSFISRLFSPKCFDSDFFLIYNNNESNLLIPECTKYGDYVGWIGGLNHALQTPSWLGLPNSAERVLLTQRGSETISKLLRMELIQDEEEHPGSSSFSSEQVAVVSPSSTPAWISNLETSLRHWDALLPPLDPLLPNNAHLPNPLYRYYVKEIKSCGELVRRVREDLKTIESLLQNKIKSTDELKKLQDNLITSVIPESWKKSYKIPQTNLINWFNDLNARIKQFEKLTDIINRNSKVIEELTNYPINLGYLFNPEGYLIATKQVIAQVNGWSIEELELKIIVSDEKSSGDKSPKFIMSGLKCQGCVWKDGLNLSPEVLSELPNIFIHWSKKTSGVGEKEKSDMIKLPVYLNLVRNELLFTINIKFNHQDYDKSLFYERGIAIIASTLI